MHSTNYYDTFISVADDCPADDGAVPPTKKNVTVAALQYELIALKPYRYTSDEVLFDIFAHRNEIPPTEADDHRARFFGKGQACLRASPLAERYGWGIHHDAEGRVAAYPRGSDRYIELSRDPRLKQLKAMKSSR